MNVGHPTMLLTKRGGLNRTRLESSQNSSWRVHHDSFDVCRSVCAHVRDVIWSFTPIIRSQGSPQGESGMLPASANFFEPITRPDQLNQWMDLCADCDVRLGKWHMLVHGHRLSFGSVHARCTLQLAGTGRLQLPRFNRLCSIFVSS